MNNESHNTSMKECISDKIISGIQTNISLLDRCVIPDWLFIDRVRRLVSDYDAPGMTTWIV